MEEYYIGFDGGYTRIKLKQAKGGQLFTMPTASAPVNDIGEYTLTGNGNGLVTVIRPDGTRYDRLVGEAAIGSAYTYESKAAQWVLGDEYMALFLAAMCQAIEDKDVVIHTLVTGLPASDREGLSRSLSVRLRGRHVCVVGHQERIVTVENVIVPTQPYCALADLALNDRGQSRRNEFATGSVIVCDVGGRTAHVQPAIGMDTRNLTGYARDFGLLPAMEKIMAEIRRAYNLSPSIAEVSAWLAAGEFPVRGEKVKIARFAAPHLYPLIGVIAGLLDQITDSDRYSQVALVGGGALALSSIVDADGKAELHKRIATRFVWPTVPTDPVGCVARGAAKIAAYHAARG